MQHPVVWEPGVLNIAPQILRHYERHFPLCFLQLVQEQLFPLNVGIVALNWNHSDLFSKCGVVQEPIPAVQCEQIEVRLQQHVIVQVHKHLLVQHVKYDVPIKQLAVFLAKGFLIMLHNENIIWTHLMDYI